VHACKVLYPYAHDLFEGCTRRMSHCARRWFDRIRVARLAHKHVSVCIVCIAQYALTALLYTSICDVWMRCSVYTAQYALTWRL
jgi:hypothetical protein